MHGKGNVSVCIYVLKPKGTAIKSILVNVESEKQDEMCVCVCVRVTFGGYYCIHVQIIECQILYSQPPDIAACHVFPSLLFTDSHSVYLSLSPPVFNCVFPSSCVRVDHVNIANK